MTAPQKLEGRRALVTGAGTGVGRGIARELARAGAKVVLHYAHSAEGVEQTVEQIRLAGGVAMTAHADFRNPDAVPQLAEQAVKLLDGIDILVNNAGITHNVPIDQITPSHFDTLMNVNVRAGMFLIKEIAPHMARNKRGAIVNITSVHAYAGMTGHAVYAATKGAIVAYTREVALELIPHGIRVNAVAPGWVRVENQEQALGSSFPWEEATQAVPVGFAATPDDIGKVVTFLCSEDARFILGQTLVADGGQLAIMPLTGDFREPRGVQFGKGYVEN